MTELSLEIEVPPRVVRGFPVWAGVTIANLTDDVGFGAVPTCSPLADGVPLALSFRSAAGEVREVGAAHEHLEGLTPGLPLAPREIRRGTADLSSAIAALTPGRWELTASFEEPAPAIAAPVAFEVVAAEDGDAEVAARLAARNDADEVGWCWFLMAGGTPLAPEELEGLGPHGREALRLWLFLHDAIQGAAPPGALDVAALDGLDGPALAAEGALLRHELFCLRGAPNADGLAAAIEERWPGVHERLDANRAGRGMLTTLRDFFGPG